MNRLITFILCLCWIPSFGQHLYDQAVIQEIEVNFEQNNWDALMDAEKEGAGDYIMAASISINGVVFDSVGVKYKGNSSYRANQVKNPWHIELDTYKEQDYQGYTDIKLSNGYKDPSCMREALSLDIATQYMDVPESNFANLKVNGQLIGMYTNTESISKRFVKRNFGSKSNVFVKCNPIGGAGPQSSDRPDLVYLGQDSSAYMDSYEMKSDYGWQTLINLCDTLTNATDEIENVLDVDRALWMLAFNNVMVNLDSYIGRFAQNYYLYQDDNGRFIPMIWDLNESFGVFASTGTINLNSTQAKQTMTPLLHSTSADFPLVSKLLENDTYRRMYLAHMKTILLENFDNKTYYTTAEFMKSTIDASVSVDQNKFYTYNNFLTNIDDDITIGGGPMGGSIPGLKNLMDGRSEYLLNSSEFTNVEPKIDNIMVSDELPQLYDIVNVVAEVEGHQSVILGYRYDKLSPFIKVEMLDDGLHGDGQANDGIFGSDVELLNTTTQYFIYAENDQAGLFSPRRAEYEYHNIETSVNQGAVVINELLASNDAVIADQAGEYDDWIELYNNSTDALDLSGYSLSDDVSDPGQWEFPQGTSIGGGEYLIVWADDDEDQEDLHANFKLSSGGETLYLSNSDGDIVDQVTFANQTTDISYGRFPNGTGDFTTMVPTYNAKNTINTSVSDLTSLDINIYPNPAESFVTIDADKIVEEIELYSLDGTRVLASKINNGSLTISIQSFPPGLYLVKAISGKGQVVLRKLVLN